MRAAFVSYARKTSIEPLCGVKIATITRGVRLVVWPIDSRFYRAVPYRARVHRPICPQTNRERYLAIPDKCQPGGKGTAHLSGQCVECQKLRSWHNNRSPRSGWNRDNGDIYQERIQMSAPFVF